MSDDARIEELRFFAVGGIPSALVLDIVERVSRAIGLPCRVVDGAPEPTIVALPGRMQADADRLLADVEARADSTTAVLVALATHDMGSPIFTHFFGRSRLHGRAVVVSIARLTPTFYGLPDDDAVTARRAAFEVLHEVGHVAGLRHCTDRTCLMHLAHDVESIDLRGTTFCGACASHVAHALRPTAPRPRS